MASTATRATAPTSAAGALAMIGGGSGRSEASAADKGFGAALAAAGSRKPADAGDGMESATGRGRPDKLDPEAAAAETAGEPSQQIPATDSAGLTQAAETGDAEAVSTEEEGELPEGIAALLASLMPATPARAAAQPGASVDSSAQGTDLLAGSAGARQSLVGGRFTGLRASSDAPSAQGQSDASADAEMPAAALEAKPFTAQTNPAQITPAPQGAQDVLRQLALQAGMVETETEGLHNPPGVDGTTFGSNGVLHAAQSQQSLHAQATAAEQPLRHPVATPRWAEELGSRMLMMSTRGQQEGSLTLTPEHLGPLEVRINVNQNTAHVWFGAQHADTRAALTEALPRLREMFAEAGLSLGQADVSQQAPRDGSPGSAREFGSSGREEEPAIEARSSVRRVTSGLLDLYA